MKVINLILLFFAIVIIIIILAINDKAYCNIEIFSGKFGCLPPQQNQEININKPATYNNYYNYQNTILPLKECSYSTQTCLSPWIKEILSNIGCDSNLEG